MIVIAALAAGAAALAVGFTIGWLLFRTRLETLRRALAYAREVADLDPVTSLHNRRYFNAVLASEVARAQRYERNLALLVIDLDNFKAVNDRLGHLAGDAVLAGAARCMLEVVRTADIACRVGGDELAVILPESTAADAERIYTRLQEALARRSGAPLSASGGVAEIHADDDDRSFFHRADEALYTAKRAGKAQIGVA